MRARHALADLLEANAEHVIEALVPELEQIRAWATGAGARVTTDKLLAEATRLGRLLPSCLRSAEPEVTCFATDVSEPTHGQRWRPALFAAIMHSIWRIVVVKQGAVWSGAVVCRLRQDCARHLSILLGLTADGYARGLEALLHRQADEHLRLSSACFTAQEAEMRRIAQDVHELVAQVLAAAHYRAESAQRLLQDDGTPAATEMKEAQTLIGCALSHARDIILDLRPMVLDRLGLQAAIQGYVDRLQRDGRMCVDFQGNGYARELSPEVEAHLFRIVRSAFSHLILPSGARRADVSLSLDDDRASLVIQADACPPGDLPDDPLVDAIRSQALALIRQRVELFGGALQLDAGSQACRLEVTAPVGDGTL